MTTNPVDTKTPGPLRVKTEPPDSHEMKNFAETTMNELLAWYGYDKVDKQDTEQLKLAEFASKADADADADVAAATSNPGSPSQASSDDADNSQPGDSKSTDESSSELAAQHKALVSALNQGSESSTAPAEKASGGKTGEVIICGWCQKTGLKLFTLKTSTATKVFCSEVCFTQCRRASFKKNKVCDWCKHVRHTVNYVDFQDGENQLQFCSKKCLNQYKMNIFCRETQEHLLQIKGGGDASVPGPSSDKQILITPELWMQQNASEFAAAKLKMEAKALEDEDAESGRESSSAEPMAIEVKPIDNKSVDERFNSGVERRSLGIRAGGMERGHMSRDVNYNNGRVKSHRSRSRDSLPASAATSPGSSQVSSSPHTRVDPTPPALGSAVPEPRSLLGGLGGFPGPPFMYPGLLPGAMQGLLPPGMLMPRESHTAGRGGATPEGSNTPRPSASNSTPPHPYLLPPMPPGAGFMHPPPPGFLPSMGFPMPPLHPGLLGAPPPPGLLPPNTLLAPYPVFLPIPVPVPIAIPVKTDKDVQEILNMYKSKTTTVKKEGEATAFPECSSSSSNQPGHPTWTCPHASGKETSPQPDRECHSASHDSISSSEMGCHGNRIACACCQVQKVPPSREGSPHWSHERPHSTSYQLNGSDGSSRDCDLEGEVIDLSKDKASTHNPNGSHLLDKHKAFCSEPQRERASFNASEPPRMSSPRDPGTITIVPTPPGGLGEHPDPALIPILPVFMRPGQPHPAVPNGGHLLPPRDHSYSSRRNLILDAPGGRREHSSSPPPEKRILLRSPSREAQFKRRCMRRSIKSK